MRFKLLLHIIIIILVVLSFQDGFAQSRSSLGSDTPEIVVTKYINALGQRNFKKAYSYIKSRQWGDESDFIYGFGGITETIILEKPTKKCLTRGGVSCLEAFVDVKYFAKDPSNDIKTCKKAGMVYDYRCLLTKVSGEWKIIKGTLNNRVCDPSPVLLFKENMPKVRNSSPSKNSPAKVNRSDINPGQSEGNGGQAKQTPNKPTKAKEQTVEKSVFTEIFNPEYWYVYVILVLGALIIGLLSFLPIRIMS